MSGFNKKNQGGLRVAHDFDDFMEDREVVLTLQDSYILGGQDVNRDGDVLENIDMAEVYKSQVNIENRTAKKDDYLDNKYAFGEKKMLAHYDEKSTEKEGIMLDSLGEFNLERQRKIEAIKNKLAGPKKGGEISLETSKNNVASEYFTSDEMKKFKKPIKKANNVKKNREDILKFLEDTIEDEDGNLGTRDAKKARERADLDDVTTKKLKTENYEAALEKAREQTKYSTMVDEEYDEVQRAIENQRRAAQQKVNKVEDVVRTLIETNKTANSIDNEVVVLDNKKKPADAEFIELDTIKASTDFLRGVATKDLMLEQKAKITEPVSLSLKDTRNGMASVVNVSLPSERLLARNKAQSGLESLKALRKDVPVANSTTEITDKKEDTAADDVFTKEDMEQLNEERNFIEEEDFNEGGLAAALKAARERGYLMENEAEIRGRGKDKTYREELAKFDKPGKKDDGEDRVKLEYRDKNGRLMTPKEAFRYQCRIFHGIDSSKTKQEKERKKWEASKKLLQTAPQESGSMKAFQILQKQNNQAHVVLDTKNLK